MNKKIAILLIAVLLFNIVVITQVEAKKMTLSVDAFESATSKASDYLKKTVFLWYTTDSANNLKAEYETQRKVVDLVLYFILFFSLSLLGLRKVFDKEGGNAVIGLSFAIGALLSLALVTFVKPSPLALLFPFAKHLLFLIVMLIVYIIMTKITGDDTSGKKIFALILAAVITYFAFGFIGIDILEKADIGLSREDQTEKIIELEGDLGADPGNKETIASLAKAYYTQGRVHLNRGEYEEAREMFVKTIQIDEDASTNKYFKPAAQMLRERMFNEAAKRNVRLMKEIVDALKELKDYYKTNPDDKKTCETIGKLAEGIDKFYEELDTELKKQEARLPAEEEEQSE